MPCSECPAPVYALGICKNHYDRRRYRQVTYGDPDASLRGRESLQDFGFARALGEELRRAGAHTATVGTLGHHWALDRAWAAAEGREGR